MSIDVTTAARVAHLARIRVDEAASVTPMAAPVRADEVTDGGIQERVLANAPDAREGFFSVPKVVE